MTQGQPFNIKTFLFDILLCISTTTFFWVLISLIIVRLAEYPEAGIAIALFIAIPLGTLFFYAIRRRFNLRYTIIQIILTISTTIIFGITLQYLKNILTNLSDSDEYLFFSLTSIILAFVTSKHLSDYFIIKRKGHSTTLTATNSQMAPPRTRDSFT